MQRLFEFDEHIGDWRVLVQSRDIKNGAIQGRHIAPEAIGAEQIADGAVTTPKIADGAVTTPKIANGAVTREKIADGAIDNILSVFDEFLAHYRPIVINGDVTNAPDEEDITSQDGLLKLKDRPFTLNNMGCIILRRGKPFSEQLTQTNTIYKVMYGFEVDTHKERRSVTLDGSKAFIHKILANLTIGSSQVARIGATDYYYAEVTLYPHSTLTIVDTTDLVLLAKNGDDWSLYGHDSISADDSKTTVYIGSRNTGTYGTWKWGLPDNTAAYRKETPYYYGGGEVTIPAGRYLTLLDTDNCVLIDPLHDSILPSNGVFAGSSYRQVAVASLVQGSYPDAYQMETPVVIPEGSLLEFEGGSLRGIIAGNIANETICSEWFTDGDSFIKSVNCLTGYKSIHMKPGDTLCSCVALTPNVPECVIAGNGATLKRSDSNGETSKRVLDVTVPDSVVIRDLNLDGGAADAADHDLPAEYVENDIAYFDCHRVAISGMSVRNFVVRPGYHSGLRAGLPFFNYKNVDIDRLTVDDVRVGNELIWFVPYGVTPSGIFENWINTIGDDSTYSVTIKNSYFNGRYFSPVNCLGTIDFEWNRVGYSSGSALNVFVMNSRIANNVFNGNRKSAVIDFSEGGRFFKAKNNIVENNTVNDSGGNFVYAQKAQNIIIRGNSFKGDVDAENASLSRIFEITGARNVTIENNEIREFVRLMSLDSASVGQTDNVNIKDNVFDSRKSDLSDTGTSAIIQLKAGHSNIRIDGNKFFTGVDRASIVNIINSANTITDPETGESVTTKDLDGFSFSGNIIPRLGNGNVITNIANGCFDIVPVRDPDTQEITGYRWAHYEGLDNPSMSDLLKMTNCIIRDNTYVYAGSNQTVKLLVQGSGNSGIFDKNLNMVLCSNTAFYNRVLLDVKHTDIINGGGNTFVIGSIIGDVRLDEGVSLSVNMNGGIITVTKGMFFRCPYGLFFALDSGTINSSDLASVGNGSFTKIGILRVIAISAGTGRNEMRLSKTYSLEGTTAERPVLTDEDSGFDYFDTTLNKEIHFSPKIGAKIGSTDIVNANTKVFATIGSGSGQIPLSEGQQVSMLLRRKYNTVYFSKVNVIPEGRELPDDDDLLLAVSPKTYDNNYTYVVAPDPAVYPYLLIVTYTSTSKLQVFNAYPWVEGDGAVAGVARSGATEDRPGGFEIYVGFQFLDITLGKPIYAKVIADDGTVTWVDGTGVTV